MAGVLCSMVGATFVSAAAEVIRKKNGVTAVGNAQVDTAQSKFGGASALFDGVDDYLKLDEYTTSGDFTIECWFRLNSTTGNQSIFTWGNSTNGTMTVYQSAGTLYVDNYNVGNINCGSVTTATWYHFAIVRSGSTAQAFVNGVSKGTATWTTTFGSGNFWIGNRQALDFDYNGWIDEFRISKNARYTTGFTPSTTPFTNDSNTVLLIHCDGTDASTYFEDDNGVRDKKAITAIGNAQISTAQSKFGGASALLDGTGDYLTTSAVESTATQFTIEGWFYITNKTTRSFGDVWQGDIGQSNRRHQVYFVYSGAEANRIYLALGVTSPFTFLYVPYTVTINTWFHLAISRDSNNDIRWFINGTQVGTTQNNSREFFGNSSTTGRIGSISYNAGAGDLFGYIDEFRISTTARYTANFTPSTTPFVNDSSTALLLHMNGTNASTVFIDDNGTGRSPHGVAAIGNAQVDTAQSKFGGASALFDGSGDYLQIPNNSAFNFGSGDFTIECWVRAANFTNLPSIMGMATVGSNDGWNLQFNTSGLLYIEYGIGGGNPTTRANTTAVSTNTWTHVAFVRNGTTVTAYKDGVAGTSHTISTNSINSSTANLIIGDGYGISTTWSTGTDFNGHIDEVRISNIARYTANFTPSTTPFQNDANTVLLLHMDGTDASTVFVDDNGTTPS